MVENFKCYVCNDDNVVKVFYPKGKKTRHYYCKSCAKKYLIKIREKC
jgi:transcription elongation factor Elf1